ncbi:anti-sigma factor [Streptomyces bauhiniae]|uniref:Regulator of SigK n=1 Tax=Streptomyces bauhiniae TaxID=2340725 RepID=A0A7K3QKF8_9ACTN|nr:anti-sigma factor [Streptomyces bauhiniae]NEB90377.1 anti-sigma factor [Streptomyces bauhiniae]
MTTAPGDHDAVGAYVLDALPPDERAAFENHLAACTACQEEAAQLMEAVVGLAEAVSLPPDDAARARVLAGIRDVRQETPPARPGRAQRVLPWALAACLAAAVAGGSIAWWQHEEAGDARRTAQEQERRTASLADVLTAPDSTVRTGELSNGGRGSVVVSRQKQKAAFLATGLPALSEGKVYQLWYADNGTTFRSGGLLPGRGGRQGRVLLGPLGRATAIGITVEPAGGSKQPTAAPLAVVQL